MAELVVATTNAGKAREFTEILGNAIDVIIPEVLPEVIEDGRTLAENAYKKARSAADNLGCRAVADDSGLFVVALGGVPGVHSARYSGRIGDDVANRAKLLTRMEGVGDRSAYFATVLCVCDPFDSPREPLFFEGRCNGRISTSERGSQGFGYDSLFIPLEGDGRTFGEMTSLEKSRISHRARAISKLKDSLT